MQRSVKELHFVGLRLWVAHSLEHDEVLLRRHLLERDLYVLLFAVAQDAELHFLAGLVGPHCCAQILRVLQRFPIELEHAIELPEPGLFRRPALDGIHDTHSRQGLFILIRVQIARDFHDDPQPGGRSRFRRFDLFFGGGRRFYLRHRPIRGAHPGTRAEHEGEGRRAGTAVEKGGGFAVNGQAVECAGFA